MPKGNNAKIGVLNFYGRNQPVTQPATLYLALYQTDPTDSDTGTEVSYTNYVRPAVTFSVPQLSGGTAIMQNSNKLEFAVVPATSGSCAYVALKDAPTGGNVVYYGALNATYTLSIGVQPIVPIGSLTVTER